MSYLRVTSWNVNGLRACASKGFAGWLHGCGAQIVALQEVRARREQLPEDLANDPRWWVAVTSAERPGYSGVALFSRRPPDQVRAQLGDPAIDSEGRLQFAQFGGLLVVNGYFPNGNGYDRDLSRIPYKLEFYRRLLAELEPLAQRGERILVVGDWNTAHREIDLARPKENQETSGFRPEERAALVEWFTAGWVDTFRHFHSDGGHYTWWSQRRGVRERNIGWRIDHIIASPGVLPFLRDATIHTEVLGSDHCPISVDLDPAVITSCLQ